MTHGEFRNLLQARIDKILSVLDLKAAEYAPNNERLHNFKRAAAMLEQTPAQACVGMMAKHLISVLDIVDADANSVRPKTALLDEKIGDAINYLILLEALLVERAV